VLLADEPTGNLDPETAERVFQQLLKLVQNNGLTAIIATHNLDLARRMTRIWKLDKGKLAEVAPVDI
jgi:lipoprotein-releasing system ATP-binding protein